ESLIKQVLRAYIFCGACGNNRTNRGGFQFAAARLPWFGRVDKVYSGPVDEMLRKHSRFNHLCMGGEKIEKVGEVIRKSYGHFLNDNSLLTAIYIRHVDREFDTEYHSAEELNLVDPRPKAGVIDISRARQKPSETF
ncbi:hypothetical protein OFP78_22805, partial [Escherichia coli]|nr:hypothetical protein [Escherichia coli]